ncbi:MAG: methyl-accepting chemotaxis protein [Burkholderiaceae bacterium]
MRTELELSRHAADDASASDDAKEALGVDIKAYDELARNAEDESTDHLNHDRQDDFAADPVDSYSAPSVENAEADAELAYDPAEEEALAAALRKKQRSSSILVRMSLLFMFLFLAGAGGMFYWYQLEGQKVEELRFKLGESIARSQELSQIAVNAVHGERGAFEQASIARENFAGSIWDMTSTEAIAKTPRAMHAPLSEIMGAWQGASGYIEGIIRNQALLEAARSTNRSVKRSSGAMLGSAQNIVDVSLSGRLSARRVAQAGELALLTQQISYTTDQFLTPKSGRFGRVGDLPQLLESAEPLLAANAKNYKKAAVEVADIRDQLASFVGPLTGLIGQADLLRQLEEDKRALRDDLSVISNLMVTAREAVPAADTEREWMTYAVAALALLSALTALGLSRAYKRGSDARAEEAELQKNTAERLRGEANRLNDLNQAAILRLMNELQEVADGDLTVQATVSEDITGAIADSVNYTVEELRNLVARINSTAEMVNEASSKAQMTSSSLQTASEQQSREIRETGEAVLRMAQQINEVSARAAESVDVAQNSLSASQGGAQAVNHAIGGMNVIRDQIQETAKRIKRLGESSQEIGEIVELISDLTEQTNVLALNAAIQAASAGEAGRGFTIVAEEVQRLAERSGEATNQIAMLIKTIQADTQDAVAAMERSTQGVVEGTRRSDEAGKSLESIGSVSAELAKLIEGFSETTSRQAASAGTVAQSIQRILLVTEQTSKGTSETAGSISQLSELAQELKNSVSRFKVA